MPIGRRHADSQKTNYSLNVRVVDGRRLWGCLMTREMTAYQLLTSGMHVAVHCHACDWRTMIGGKAVCTAECIVDLIIHADIFSRAFRLQFEGWNFIDKGRDYWSSCAM